MLKNILAALTICVVAAPVLARDNIQIAGSSTVLPYASIVAEVFRENFDFPAPEVYGENFNFPTPVVESGGTSAGLKRFCGGVGTNSIDIANASRAIREKEISACAENGVTEITEVLFGYDGIVFANNIEAGTYHFEPLDIFLALNSDSNYTNWSQINLSHPNEDILMFIPGTKHGTREVFEEKVLLKGCMQYLATEDLTDDQETWCMSVRTDGKAVDIDGDYTETLASIRANRNGIGVFGLSFYENNTDIIKVATMNGVFPSVETVSSGEYPVSRPLFFYIKNAHVGVIPGVQEFAQFFVSDEMSGPNGPLAFYGLVPSPTLKETQETVRNLTPLE